MAAVPRFKINGIQPTELSTRPPIFFIHPGYPPEDSPSDTNVHRLISLPRTDRSSEGTFGVHHRTALLACQIIANNAFDGSYLALDREGQQRERADLDGVLVEKQYFFIADPANPTEQYAIVPSFRDWRFPSQIPEHWPEVTPRNDHVDGADRCGLTNFTFPIDNAHLVPTAERDWYLKNTMTLHTRHSNDINSLPNRLRLRIDLHKVFDKRGFIIVPKPDEANRLQYVTQVITTGTTEFWPKYHDLVVQRLHRDSRAYLLARFAWAIFLGVKDFVISGMFDRRVIWRVVITQENGQPERAPRTYTTEVATPEMLDSLYGGGGPNDTKPMRKRKNPENVDSDDSDGSSSGTEEIYSTWDLREGGRKRARRSCGYP